MAIIDFLSTILWSHLLIYTLIPIGLYFTYKLRFAQFTNLGHMLTLIQEKVVSKDPNVKPVSAFGAFSISSASRVGTGNLAGVAIAIFLGGAGAIFWMWMIALIGAASSLIENTLAQAYKVKSEDGTYRGGPAYYMAQGLGSKKMALVFSILITISFGLVFNSVQANTIASAFHGVFEINVMLVASVLGVATAAVIFGGLKRIVQLTQVLFPVMAILYLVATFFIIVMNVDQIVPMFGHIFESAFGFEQASSGAFGFMVMQGIKRGLFSNEAGMGSTPNAGATAEVSHPVKQGLIQTLGVFVDTLLISTATAFVILLTQVGAGDSSLTGIQLTQMALVSSFGDAGGVFLAILVLLFSFSSIVGNYYYGESNIEYLTDSKLVLNGFRIAVVFMVVFGTLASLNIVWNLADVFMGFMALLNMIAIFMLRKVAFKLFEDYEAQRKAGKNPIFHKDAIGELKDVECWDNDHNFLHLKAHSEMQK